MRLQDSTSIQGRRARPPPLPDRGEVNNLEKKLALPPTSMRLGGGGQPRSGQVGLVAAEKAPFSLGTASDTGTTPEVPGGGDGGRDRGVQGVLTVGAIRKLLTLRPSDVFNPRNQDRKPMRLPGASHTLILSRRNFPPPPFCCPCPAAGCSLSTIDGWFDPWQPFLKPPPNKAGLEPFFFAFPPEIFLFDISQSQPSART